MIVYKTTHGTHIFLNAVGCIMYELNAVGCIMYELNAVGGIMHELPTVTIK